jgi:tripartite-type tricarboxylate transporter receptor subunit TctC
MRRPMGFEPRRALSPIAGLVTVETAIVVRRELGVRNLGEFIELARKRPGELTYASPGTAQVHTLATELLMSRLGIQLLQIPFQGVAPGFQAILSDTVDFGMFDAGTIAAHAGSGRVLPLAVIGAKRCPLLKSVPTLGELGFQDLDLPLTWIGVFGPSELPAAVVQRLNAAINSALRNSETVERASAQGLSVLGGSSAQLNELIVADMKTWPPLIAQLRLQID